MDVDVPPEFDVRSWGVLLRALQGFNHGLACAVRTREPHWARTGAATPTVSSRLC